MADNYFSAQFEKISDRAKTATDTLRRLSRSLIAVGTALTGGPPRRSQRAGLPHWAPALGVWRQSVPPGRGA